MWKEFTSQRLPSNENSMDSGLCETDNKNSDASAASRNPSFVSQITNTVWKGITNQTAMETPPSPIHTPTDIPEAEVDPQTTSNLWSYAEKLKGSDTVASLSKLSSNWRARALWNSSSSASPQSTNILAQKSSRDLSSGSYEQDSSRASSSLSMHGSDLLAETASEGSSQQSNKSLIEKTRSLLYSPSQAPKSAPRPLLLTTTLANSGQRGFKSHRNLANSTTMSDTVEWGDVMREKQHYIYRDSLSSTSSLSPSDRYVRTPKSDRESDTSSSRIVSLNRRSISPMAPNFRPAHERLQSRTSSASSGFPSPPILPRSSPLPHRQTTDAPIASGSPTILQTRPFSDRNGCRTVTSGSKEFDDSDTTSNERSSVIRLTESENAELPIQASLVRSKPLPNLKMQDDKRPQTSVEEKGFNSSQLTVEWPRDEIEIDPTPKRSRFGSEERDPMPRKLSRSPLRSKKLATEDLERQRKVSVDTIKDYRQRKVSNGHRPRKISTEREIPKNKRDSSAEEGDDEGYDELLSAYESEDGPRSFLQ